MLENIDIIRERITVIINERERLYRRLACLDGVHVYPSKTNFLLLRVYDADKVYRKLLKDGILVRNFSGNSRLKDCLRVTVGTAENNDIFLQKLEQVLRGQ